jgi:chemotaxis protein CheX
MTCPRALARHCAARMHGRDPAALTPAEVTDGWGELVNMVGRSLKGMLPPPSWLSLPVAREHPTYSYREEGTRVINELTFACLGRRLRLAVARRGA